MMISELSEKFESREFIDRFSWSFLLSGIPYKSWLGILEVGAFITESVKLLKNFYFENIMFSFDFSFTGTNAWFWFVMDRGISAARICGDFGEDFCSSDSVWLLRPDVRIFQLSSGLFSDLISKGSVFKGEFRTNLSIFICFCFVGVDKVDFSVKSLTTEFLFFASRDLVWALIGISEISRFFLEDI